MIEKYITNLVNEFHKNNFEEIDSLNNCEKMVALYSFYHYFSADNSRIDELMDGILKDSEIPGLNAIYRDKDADEFTMDLLVSYDVQKEEFNFANALYMFSDIEKRLFELYEKRTSSRIKEILSENSCYISKENNHIKIKILVDFIPKLAAMKKAIANGLKINKPVHKNVEYEFVFGDKIENNILELEDPKEYVSCAELSIDNADNITKYGVEKSFICNISAFDIKRIYEEYSYRGLFAQNLRYYIDTPKIDDNIVYSIQTRPDFFWYLNNGIIIICDNCIFEGKKLLLENFSIINGGQTTYLIGETDFQKDFYVQCKIIINKFNDEASRLEFIANVAEATNTQKPIKPKDLVANRTEQRKLKKQLADSKIFCSIKRGQKVNKKIYSEPWQITNNEELAQILYAFMYQNPGTAKGGKSSLCGNEEKYSLIFAKQYNTNLLKDLLYFKMYFKKWAKLTVKKIDKEMQDGRLFIDVTKHGYYYLISIFGLFLKLRYHELYIKENKLTTLPDQKREIISQFDFDHKIFKSDMTETEVYALLDYFSKLFVTCFKKFVEIKSETTQSTQYVSNFVKSDANYYNYVVDYIFDEFENNKANYESIINSVVYLRNDEEVKYDEQLLKKYRNPLVAELKDRQELPEETYELLYDKLKEFRTKTFRRNHIKAYEICKDNALKLMAKYGPTNIDELISLRCMDEYQIEKYGEDFVEIINNILSY